MISNLFDPIENEKMLARIEALHKDSKPLWGKMNVEQMMAHINLTFKYTYGKESKWKPNFLQKLAYRLFLKPLLTNEKPFKRDLQTAPVLRIVDEKDFSKEKERLKENVKKMCEMGASYFEGKPNLMFGKMSAKDWNTMYSKHIDHHLHQFGVQIGRKK